MTQSGCPLRLGAESRPLVQGAHVRTDLKLLEVEPGLLQEILTNGVIIKGPQVENEAVMCTSSKTYALKYVETTNSLLLVQQPQEDLPDAARGSQGSPGCLQASGAAFTPPGLQTQLYRLHQSSAAPVVVAATASGHIETVECGPRLELLHQMLAQRPFKLEDEDEGRQPEADDDIPQGSSRKRQVTGDTCDDRQGLEAGASDGAGRLAQGSGSMEGGPSSSGKYGSGSGLYTFDDLVNVVQASPKEIQAELAAMGAVELDGFWRCVDPDYLGSLLELIIKSAQEQGFPLAAIPSAAIVEAVLKEEAGYPACLVTHCLRVYGHQAAPLDNGQASTSETWCLDSTKVCIYYMDKVLAMNYGVGVKDGSRKRTLAVASTASAARPLNEFMQGWRDAVPSGIQPDLSMLRGEVLVEGKGSTAVIHPLSVRQLPINPKQRFERLFAFKPRWEATELEPYLQGMQAPGQTPATLLLKYARASQSKADAPTYYTAR